MKSIVVLLLSYSFTCTIFSTEILSTEHLICRSYVNVHKNLKKIKIQFKIQ